MNHITLHMEKAEAKGVKMLIPIDTVVTKEFKNDTPFHVVEAGHQEDDDMGMDIGPKTRELYKEALADAKTVVWNGPMGVFEFDNFAAGTIAVAEELAQLKDATTIIGGGDSAAADNPFRTVKIGFLDPVDDGSLMIALKDLNLLPGLFRLFVDQIQ